jgi:hypothetical protein
MTVPNGARMRIALLLTLIACGARTGPAPDAPMPETARETAPEAPASTNSDCSPTDLALGDGGACDGVLASWTEGDFFYVGLTDPEARFTCGRCDDCEEVAVGTPVTLRWEVQSIEIPEGSPATLQPLITRCETR